MTRRLIVLLAVAAALAAVSAWFIYRTMSTTPGTSALPPANAPQQAVQTVNGETVVAVAPAVQHASHIDVAPLASTAIRSEVTAYATVLDLQPLFDLHDRLLTAGASRDSLRGQAVASRAQYRRSQILFDDNRNISEKALQDARAAMQTDQAKLLSADAAQRGLKAMLRQQFGDALASAAEEKSSPLFRRLFAGRSMIVRVTLPIDSSIVPPAIIAIESPDGRRIAANKLSSSPQSDPALQGISYLYAANALLPFGTHATAHIPSGASGASGDAGVLIPESAVVWYGGQAWTYVRTAADRFTRRFVPSAATVDRGFVVTSGFQAGDQVVIHGAQLLLSEELRPQGVATQCNDPPECND